MMYLRYRYFRQIISQAEGIIQYLLSEKESMKRPVANLPGKW